VDFTPLVLAHAERVYHYLLPASAFRPGLRGSVKTAGFGPPAILTLANRPITLSRED